MNIFVTDSDPEKCAQALDDARVRKMVVETAQMVSVAAHLMFGITPIYKSAFVNHPCNLWIRSSLDHYSWMVEYFYWLSAEHLYRFGTVNGASRVGQTIQKSLPHLKSPKPPEYFVNAARREDRGVDFTHIANVPEAYRRYLNARWHMDKIDVRWTERNKPEWCEL